MQGVTGGGGKNEQTSYCQLCFSGKLVSIMIVSYNSAPSLLFVSPCQEEEVGGRQAGILFSISGVSREKQYR